MHLLLISTATDKFISAFSWMLIHSLWQGMLVAILAGVTLMFNKKRGASFRYNLAFVLFFAFIAACSATFLFEWNNVATRAQTSLSGGLIYGKPNLSFINAHELRRLGATLNAYFSANAPFIVLLWLVFFLFKSVKMIAGMVYNQRIRSYKIYRPAQFWQERLIDLCHKLGINKTVSLLESGYIKMPVVIGHLKPIILVPVGLLAGMPTAQVEAILLHELAHIRRNDYMVNFLQNIMEAAFFFNPGLLWISALLKEERENCCDDMALEQTQDKRGFVQALISFKEHQLYGSVYAPAFAGKKNHLLNRVMRIMNNDRKVFGFGEKMFFVTSTMVIILMLTTITIGQIREYEKDDHHFVNTVLFYTRLPDPPAPNAVAKPAVKHLKNMRLSNRMKMKIGMAGIMHSKDSTVVIPPVAAVLSQAIVIKKQEVLTEKQQADQDRERALVDQAQGRLDQIQARKDQAQARIDQAQAVKDQAQARIDQQQAVKDQEQATRDQQQAVKQHTQVSVN